MPGFILIYRGPATPKDQMAEVQSSAVMALWGAWMEKRGRILDGGAPFELVDIPLP